MKWTYFILLYLKTEAIKDGSSEATTEWEKARQKLLLSYLYN